LVSLSLGSGIPLMLLIAAVALMVFTITEKYKMIHYCKKPPRLSHQFVKISIAFLSIALCLHLMFSISMLGSNYIFLKPKSSLNNDSSDSFNYFENKKVILIIS
jgi:hypothetical protein